MQRLLARGRVLRAHIFPGIDWWPLPSAFERLKGGYVADKLYSNNDLDVYCIYGIN